MPLRLLAAGKTDVGLQREQNEDAYHAKVMDASASSGIFIVSDGMGGYHAGEIASKIAVETISSELASLLDPNTPPPTVKLSKGRGRKRAKSGKKDDGRVSAATIEAGAETATDTTASEEAAGEEVASEGRDPAETRQLFETVALEHYAGKLNDAIKLANTTIVDYGDSHREARGLGATVTAALVVEGQAFIANVGDSRTYLIRDGAIERVTRDHSLVERLVEMEQITPDEVYDHPSRNLIYRSLGAGHADVDVDIFIERLQPGDALLLCCDGLWEMVHDPQLLSIISEAEDVEQACERLISTANENGGEDNITAVLVRYVEA
ncbi:MAG TPA: protein phosphatase 2C domain-containing protein [Ktedonobacterales bacterium]|nr:protein phosphatase 2C domain-containing protein [Ktedonobacterales bacterium]